MFIERYGSGNKSYFGLHGWGGDHTAFLPLVKHLPEDATLYTADLPGYGKSPAPRDWSAAAVAEQVAEAIERIRLSKIIIIGNCSGAITGLLAAPYLGNQIERFILIDPFAYMPWYFRLLASPGWGRYAYFTAFANPVGRWVTNLSLKRRRNSTSDLTQSFGDVNHQTAYNHLVLLADMKGIEDFRQIKTPIDICYGAKTFKAVKRSAAMWKSIWPHARLWELKGAGHLPIEEATEELSHIIFSNSLASTDKKQRENIPMESSIKSIHGY